MGYHSLLLGNSLVLQARDINSMYMCVQLIVHGLPFSFAWQELKDLFKPVGGVDKADIVVDPEGRSRGWGTVTFLTPADADKAIQVGSCFFI